MDTYSTLCCNNMDSLIHLFHNLTVHIIKSRVSGQCLYTIVVDSGSVVMFAVAVVIR